MKETIQIDWSNGILYKDGVRIGVWRRDGAHLDQKEFEGIIGPATRAIFREAAKQNINDIIMNQLHAKPGLKGSTPDAIARELLHYFMHLGYGIPEIVFLDSENKIALVNIRNSFNALSFKETEKPVCYILEGFLERLFEVAFGSRVECREIRCSAAGHDFCQFKVKAVGKRIKIAYMPPKPARGLSDIEVEFDPDKGTIHSRNLNCVFMPRGLQKCLENECERIIGPASKAIWYHIGRQQCLEFVGSNFLKSLLVKLVCKLSRNFLISRLEEFSILFSFGKVKWVNIDKKSNTCVMRLWNSWNAEGVKGSRKPVCYLMAGINSGGSDFVFGRTMFAEETKCIGMGDPYCEFKIYPAKKD